MNIAKLSKAQDALLQSFKKTEWPAADATHYGKNTPDFDKKSQVLLAMETGKIIGYVSFSVEGGVAELSSIIVGSEFRKRGVASKLIQSAEKEAKELGAHKIWLTTGPNWEAKMLYEKLGYKVRTTLPNHYGEREFVLMDKNL